MCQEKLSHMSNTLALSNHQSQQLQSIVAQSQISQSQGSFNSQQGFGAAGPNSLTLLHDVQMLNERNNVLTHQLHDKDKQIESVEGKFTAQIEQISNLSRRISELEQEDKKRLAAEEARGEVISMIEYRKVEEKLQAISIENNNYKGESERAKALAEELKRSKETWTELEKKLKEGFSLTEKKLTETITSLQAEVTRVQTVSASQSVNSSKIIES